MKTPITYYGGKQNMLKYILPLIPEHDVYIEPYFGGGAVFFAKQQSKIEIINDINDNVINFYSVLKNRFPELKSKIDATLHSQTLFNKAQNIVLGKQEAEDEVEKAWAFWLCANVGFSGTLDGTYGMSIKNNKGQELWRKKQSFTKELADRLNNVQIMCADAIYVINRFNRENVFIYCDPPYLNADQGHYTGFSSEKFKELVETLENFKGKFLLSTYGNEIIDEFIDKNKWNCDKIKMKVSATYSKLNPKRDKEKTEYLVYNYNLTRIL